jgi:DNA-binding PadR family transcriptional regulator
VLGDHHDSVVARTVLLDLTGKAREAGEDTFTYGLMYQRQADEAAGIEQSLPPFTVEMPALQADSTAVRNAWSGFGWADTDSAVLAAYAVIRAPPVLAPAHLDRRTAPLLQCLPLYRLAVYRQPVYGRRHHLWGAGWRADGREHNVRDNMDRWADPPLLVLASLADEPKHGYAITQDVAETMGIRLSAGTLYAVIARLESRGLIEALESEDRRRPYRITMAGAQALARQSERMSRVASLARERLSTHLGWAGA